MDKYGTWRLMAGRKRVVELGQTDKEYHIEKKTQWRIIRGLLNRNTY